MRPFAVETGTDSLEQAKTVAVLDGIMREVPVAAERRVMATDDSRSVDEGLAVLECYVAISDQRVRQAILDVLVAASTHKASA